MKKISLKSRVGAIRLNRIIKAAILLNLYSMSLSVRMDSPILFILNYAGVAGLLWCYFEHRGAVLRRRAEIAMNDSIYHDTLHREGILELDGDTRSITFGITDNL